MRLCSNSRRTSELPDCHRRPAMTFSLPCSIRPASRKDGDMEYHVNTSTCYTHTSASALLKLPFQRQGASTHRQLLATCLSVKCRDTSGGDCSVHKSVAPIELARARPAMWIIAVAKPASCAPTATFTCAPASILRIDRVCDQCRYVKTAL